MTYWETLDENRKRIGYHQSENNQSYEGKTAKHIYTGESHNESKGEMPLWETLKWGKNSEGTYNLFIPAGSVYNLLNLVKLTLPSDLNANISFPFLQREADSQQPETLTQKIIDLVKKSGNMITITPINPIDTDSNKESS